MAGTCPGSEQEGPARVAKCPHERRSGARGRYLFAHLGKSGDGGPGEGGEQAVDNFAFAAPAVISIQERRAADGLDRHVPIILRDGVPYDADLDRFFLDLPLNGVRSPHSLRAYGYDVTVWIGFLDVARGKTVWAATRSDVDAFHRARRREDAGVRISAASWNRSIAALEKLYRWAQSEGLVASSPFTHRDVWRQGHGTRRLRVVARNDSYERAARRSDVRFISLEDYRVFRDVGLRGLTVDGIERSGARDRNGARNALFAELLVTTGLRLSEARSRARRSGAACGAWPSGPVRASVRVDEGRSRPEHPRPQAPASAGCRVYYSRAGPRRRQVQDPRGLAGDRAADLCAPAGARCDRPVAPRRRGDPVCGVGPRRTRPAHHLRQ